MKLTLPPKESQERKFPKFHFKDLLEIFLEHKRLIVGCMAFCLGIGLVYVLLAPKIYRAHATVQVEMQNPKILNIQDVQADSPKDVLENAERVKTIENSLRARSLFLRVIKAQHLDEDPAFLASGIFGRTPSMTEEDIVRGLNHCVKVSSRPNTLLIDVSADHPSRDLAQRIVASLIGEFKAQAMERRGGLNEDAYQFLMKESDRLQQSLQQSELRLQEFKEEHHSVAFQDEKDNTVMERLKKLSADVTQAQTERMKAETDLVVLADRYKKRPLKMIELQNAVKKARSIEDDMVGRLKEQEQSALELNRESIPYHMLVRQVESDRSLDEIVLKRLKEIELVRGMDPATVIVVDEPYASSKPVKPAHMLILSLSLLSGLIVGCAASLIWRVFDSSIKTVEQVERLFRVPVLATIPQTGRLGMGSSEARGFEKLVVLDRPHSAATEAFRFLTASLGTVSDRKVILFTSAVPNEGKTFASCNYAVMLAKQGLQTLLIQADVKNMTLHEFFPVVVSSPGLSEYLEGTCDLNEATCPTGIERLFVIPVGEVPMTPAERFAHERWLKLIDKMSASFDRIIIDTGPVNLVSNTLTLAQNVQTVIMVIQACRTPVRVAQAAYNRLMQAGIQLSGVVLNRFPLEHLLGEYQSYYSDDSMRRGFFSGLRQRLRSKTAETEHEPASEV